jgi:hypothetical protein
MNEAPFHLEDSWQARNSGEFRTSSLPFLPGLSVEELHALHSENYGLESHQNPRVLQKTITTTKDNRGQALSCFPLSPRMDTSFLKGKKTSKHVSGVISQYIFFV